MDKVSETLNEIGEATAASSLKIGNALMYAGESIESRQRQQKSAAVMMLVVLAGFVAISVFIGWLIFK